MHYSIDRQALRRKILARRDGISAADRKNKSSVITENLFALDDFASISTVFVYVSFRSEVETMPLIQSCLSRGMKVAVPLTIAGSSEIMAISLADPDRDLRPGYCGIPEPDPGRLPAVDPAAIDAVIVPGSVFDEQGGRFGYGGGYYDRFLKNNAPTALRIGLAFEIQLVQSLPLAEHDQILHYLVTEKGVRTFSGKR